MTIGSIIFLTKRHNKPYRRIFLSYMIAVFTRKKGQPLEKVKVHTAIIYYDKGFKVRDMDKDGDTHYSLAKYKAKYKGRIEIVKSPFVGLNHKFNDYCKNTKVKYDYKNTFFWQVLKRITGLFLGKITLYERMCAEDMQICYNQLFPDYFKTPEETNPNESYELIKNQIS